MKSPSSRAARDARGLPLGTGSSGAARHADEALFHLMTAADGPAPALAAARAADPGWLLPLLMDAGGRLAAPDPVVRASARALLAEARALEAGAPARERGHLQALQALDEGRLHEALRLWDERLLEQPLDALALHWAHLWDRRRGDSRALRVRPARVLPDWDEGDPLFACVLGLYAFGLAESAQPQAAIEIGRRALELAARTGAGDAVGTRLPVAVHAVAHALESQGRFDEGSAWLRQHQDHWMDPVRGGHHLWWHLALFRLESLDVAGTFRLIDTHFSAAAPAAGLSFADTAALLWRLRLVDVEVDALFKDLLRRCPPDPARAGDESFTDWHVVMALLGAGELGRAEHWVAHCARRVMAGTAGPRQVVARDCGLPLMRALLAAARGDTAAAAAGLYLVHEAGERLGGSQVRRDLVAQTLMQVAAGSPQAHIGRAVLNERCVARTLTPLTRHWAASLGVAVG